MKQGLRIVARVQQVLPGFAGNDAAAPVASDGACYAQVPTRHI